MHSRVEVFLERAGHNYFIKLESAKNPIKLFINKLIEIN